MADSPTPEELLADYRAKRDFSRTEEPAGGDAPLSDRTRFVVQKHQARALHYDLRLEVDGVLKSWAVPKGPSPDPSVKRLAMPTEDHPLEYAEFEGTIPEGEYGGGAVIIWDRGIYWNLRAAKAEGEGRATMAASLEEGHAEVWFEGEKLEGAYALIRTGGGDRPRWLLIKMKDSKAEPGRDLTAERPESVVTGRTLEEVSEESP